MKTFKILLVLILGAFMLSTFTVSAQESATYDSKLDYSQYINTWTKTGTANTLTTTDTIWYFTVYKSATKPLKYDAFISLDSVGGTKNNVLIKLQAKKFVESPSWTDLKTVYWTTGRDTTKTITENTTAQQYQVYRIYVQGLSHTFLAKIPFYAIKFWE